MDYRSIIESRYNRENWQKLLHHIFNGREKFWNTPSPVNTSSRFAKQVLWLGTITLSDEQTIAVYEVELADSVDIERNRRGIRDMLLSEWRGNGNAGAFMFCYRKNESVLRFSYVSEAWTFAEDGSYQKESTDAKRFTYLLGEGHRSRTAIQQFEKLKDSSLNLKDLTKAFSVDAVSDMFFKEYKKNYEDIIFFVTGKRMVKVANKWEERQEDEPCEEIMQEFAHFPNPEKAVRDYVKKLMGRLVFLQFLQKKGWLGVRAGQPWGSGDGEFVQHLFADCRDKDHFVDNVLEALFNDLDSEDEIAMPQYRTPYLNGGLFERDASDESNFPLPAKYMQQLLDFFSSYNFTIDENDPDDAEVGVDPEMLGRIFENLLEDNKDKGAFYTPKEIVSYMCRESLIAYLQTDIDDEATKEAIRKFVTTHDVNLLGDITNDVDQRLKDVKICDPAIGSGAFPMGLLKELFQCRSAIEGFDQSTAAEIKKHIIQNNIYGVDIEKGAVDIARLRFWLSLIVDEETPQALPNLDFKIMRGNSLLEQYNGFDLSTIMHTKKKVEGPVQMTFFEDDVDVLRRQVIGLRREYYRETNKLKKKNLRTRMREIVQQQINTLSYNIDLSGIDIADNSEFFLWHTWFADVFEKGGFDIVIGNPPYVKEYTKRTAFDGFRETSPYYMGKMDLWYGFACHGLDMLKYDGVLCFIAQNNWTTSAGAKLMRKKVVGDGQILQMLDFFTYMVFDDADIQTMIMLFRHNSITDNYKVDYRTLTEGAKKEDMLLLMEKKIGRTKYLSPHVVREQYVNGLITFTDYEGIIDHIAMNKLYLEDNEIAQGIVPNPDVVNARNMKCLSDNSINKGEGVFVVDKGYFANQSIEEQKYIKPLFEPTQMERFYMKSTNIKEILYITKNNWENDAPRLYRHLYKYKEIMEQRRENQNGRIDFMHLHWPRDENFFLAGPKILSVRKCIGSPVFVYYEPAAYVMMAVNVIKTERWNMKYLAGLLNSKLIAFWLRNKGKMQGDNYQVDKEPLMNIPLPAANMDEQSIIAERVNSIIESKKSNPFADISALESEIDNLVYQLYGLTEEEIKIVEGQ